ncbi:hypothetical protein PPERSA_04613 [Pseudocohnilembus persalinus]|uniref:Uncharacterized protein n=1 Tax=Pseudocohnilembus persalinus TaxID=266149 RepID=A0A0V0QP21_PSEPJ|nr:hypothetical protein PPERSA_04613 [Pseudocohnilembus persalinus]|eukprot:KRX03818.1 hypothetical protein PPERSA_04613 [Pseudocohnilembus persalinus]
MQLNKQTQQIQENKLICPKTGHENSPYLYFKFSEDKNEILQCVHCNIQDQQNDKKIILEQLLQQPIWKIKNFPPLQSKEKQKSIQNTMINFSPEKYNQIKDKIKKQINKYYEDLLAELVMALEISKKDIFQQFDNLFNKSDIYKIYDMDILKKKLKQFQNQESYLDDLFKIQLDLKNKFECEKNIKIATNQEIAYKQIICKMDNLYKELNLKCEQFIQDLQINIDKLDSEQDVNFNFQQRFFNFFKKKQTLKIQDTDQDKENAGPDNDSNQRNSSNLKLKKKLKDEIEIKHNNKIIIFNDKKIAVQKSVYSEPLDKNKKYHFRFKLNLQQQKHQQITFTLLGAEDKDKFWGEQNYIFLTNSVGNCGAVNGESVVKEGSKFSTFMQDDETIFNLIVNYHQNLFELYDDERKGYVKNQIDKNKIQGEELLLGITVCQFHLKKIFISFLDISCF